MFIDNEPVAEFADPNHTFDKPGMIAFDRGKMLGSLLLDNIAISSEETFKQKTVWPGFTVGFPPDINGMDIPLCYNIETTEIGGIAK